MSDNEASFVDSHAHLDDTQFDSERDAVIQRAASEGVARIVTLGVDIASSRAAIAICECHSGVVAGVGVHPHYASGYVAATSAELRDLARHPAVVAIGEIGLDYYRDHSPRAKQREAFGEQLRLARVLGLPVVVHDRQAHDDVLDVLGDEAASRRDRRVNGVMHCFSGDVRLAEAVVALGMHISIAGPVTYPSGRDLDDVVRSVPPERLLVETDCPYLAPEPVRGQRNEPAFVVYTYQKIAELRAVSLPELARQAKGNAVALFGRRLR